MKTAVLPPGPAALERAVRLLAAGELVALPTETVYGLAGNALDPAAAAGIFQAKERPFFDPLIVHLPDGNWLERLTCCAGPAQARTAAALQARFWPGPLTMILPRRAGAVPDLVTAGSDTVAVRMSAHPVFRAVIAAFGQPLAAPSANRFGRISPTSGADVLEELGGRIPLIIEAGRTAHGLESTIVEPGIDGGLLILRHGPITAEILREFGPVTGHAESAPRAAVTPGALPGHYAPRTPLRLIEGGLEDEAARHAGRKLGLLTFRTVADPSLWQAVECLSATGDVAEAATGLFAALRRLDHAGLDLILAERIPPVGLGAAIMERLGRAAAGGK